MRCASLDVRTHADRLGGRAVVRAAARTRVAAVLAARLAANRPVAATASHPPFCHIAVTARQSDSRSSTGFGGRVLLDLALCVATAVSVFGAEAPRLVSVTFDRSEIVGGTLPGTVPGRVLLDAAAPMELSVPLIQTPPFSGTTSARLCRDADGVEQVRAQVFASAPPFVRVAAGQREGRFQVVTYLVEGVPSQVVTFEATQGGVTKSAALKVSRWRVSSFAIARNPPGATDEFSAHVALDAAAPFDLMVMLERRDGSPLRRPDGRRVEQRLARGATTSVIGLAAESACDSDPPAKIVVQTSCRSVVESAAAAVVCEPPPGLSYVAIAPQIVVSGASTRGEVGLFGPTPVPVEVVLSGESPFLQIPATVRVPAGQSKASFQILTFGVSPGAAPADVRIDATYRRDDSEMLRILPPTELSSLSVPSPLVARAAAKAAQVTLNRPFAQAVTVLLSGDAHLLEIPGQVVVPAGRVTGSFLVRAIGPSPGSAPVATRVTAKLGVTTRSAEIWLQPPGGAP